MLERSKQIRRDIIALSKANGGYHYGGSFSCVEILIALYDHILDIGRDRFILSKGHACWGYYVLLREKGYFPLLEGHPKLDLHNSVHWTTGSEGHGLPAGIGMALSRKLLDLPGKIYVLMGDGECQEGTTWESLLIASKYKLSNLKVVVDYNGIQGSGFVKDILPIDCLPKVAENCGWLVNEVEGHNILAIVNTLAVDSILPQLVIAHTIKGKGVSFMENKPEWHSCWLNDELEKAALQELK